MISAIPRKNSLISPLAIHPYEPLMLEAMQANRLIPLDLASTEGTTGSVVTRVERILTGRSKYLLISAHHPLAVDPIRRLFQTLKASQPIHPGTNIVDRSRLVKIFVEVVPPLGLRSRILRPIRSPIQSNPSMSSMNPVNMRSRKKLIPRLRRPRRKKVGTTRKRLELPPLSERNERPPILSIVDPAPSQTPPRRLLTNIQLRNHELASWVTCEVASHLPSCPLLPHSLLESRTVTSMVINDLPVPQLCPFRRSMANLVDRSFILVMIKSKVKLSIRFNTSHR